MSPGRPYGPAEKSFVRKLVEDAVDISAVVSDVFFDVLDIYPAADTPYLVEYEGLELLPLKGIVLVGFPIIRHGSLPPGIPTVQGSRYTGWNGEASLGFGTAGPAS